MTQSFKPAAAMIGDSLWERATIKTKSACVWEEVEGVTFFVVAGDELSVVDRRHRLKPELHGLMIWLGHCRMLLLFVRYLFSDDARLSEHHGCLLCHAAVKHSRRVGQS